MCAAQDDLPEGLRAHVPRRAEPVQRVGGAVPVHRYLP